MGQVREHWSQYLHFCKALKKVSSHNLECPFSPMCSFSSCSLQTNLNVQMSLAQEMACRAPFQWRAGHALSTKCVQLLHNLQPTFEFSMAPVLSTQRLFAAHALLAVTCQCVLHREYGPCPQTRAGHGAKGDLTQRCPNTSLHLNKLPPSAD